MDYPEFPKTGFVRLSHILAPNGPIPVSKSTWWQELKTGVFPSRKNWGRAQPFGWQKISALCLKAQAMARRINPSRIKKNLTYSIIEAAEELGKSIATIRNWIKLGLPVQKDQRPYLIFGSDLREFMIRMRKERQFKLQDGELNCFSCKAGRQPLNRAVVYHPHTAKTGRLSGVCSVCGGKCARIISKAQISTFSKIMQIQFNGGRAP